MAAHEYHEAMGTVVTQLVAAVTNIRLYSPTHPQVAPLIDRVYESLIQLLGDVSEVTVFIIDDELIAQNRPLTGLPAGNAFVQLLKKRGVERLTFLAGLPQSQLIQFIENLASADDCVISSSSCIKLGRVEIAGGDGQQEDIQVQKEILEGEISEFVNFREREIDALRAMYLGIKSNSRIDLNDVNDIVAEFITRFKSEMNPLSLLASLKSADEYTFVHATNVALLTMSLAEFLGFEGSYLHDIGIAALLHDVGKMVIPDEILNKAGKLSDEERAVMETHTVRGAQYLIGQKNVPKLTLLAALEHHIKFDGTGYPHVSGNWKTNIVSQMISVADVFDALRSTRPYRGPLPQEKIVGILQEDSGTAFNPELVDNFLSMIER